MSNKVIFNFDEFLISVGMNVGADFTWMSLALPNQTLVGKPYKILHSSTSSLELAVSKIKESQEQYSSVINPIITKSRTNIDIRKVHNDRFDSKKAALAGVKSPV